MLTLPGSVRIYLSTAPTDMRKGHDGLRALVEGVLGADVYSGHLFVFVSRKGDRLKILTWDHGGFVLWYKRLERGRFKLPHLPPGQESVRLDSACHRPWYEIRMRSAKRIIAGSAKRIG